MTELRAGISDELWNQIQPPHARGRWWISLTVALVLLAALASWIGGAFHPRVAFVANQTSISNHVMLINATIANESQLPLSVEALAIDEPGFTLRAWRMGETINPAVPPREPLEHFSLGRNQSRQLVLYVAIDCSAITSAMELRATLAGPVVHRVQTLKPADQIPLGFFCPGVQVAG